MNQLLKKLKPTSLSTIFLVLLILVQFLFFSAVGITFSPGAPPTSTQYAFGIGSPIVVTTMDNHTTWTLRWGVLALNLLAMHVLAIGAGIAIVKITRADRPVAVYSRVALGAIVLTFLISIGISKRYWGYYIKRPAVLSEIDSVRTVKEIVVVKTLTDGGQRTMAVDPEFSITEMMASARKDPYYALWERMLFELERTGRLPVTQGTSLDNFPPLHPLIKQTGLLKKAETGYERSDVLSGIVIDTINHSGDRLVFLGLTGLEVSNDHRPYYEMVFSGKEQNSDLSFVRGQRFFYDVAGLEGMEWYSIWLLLSLPAICVSWLLFTIGWGIRRLVRHRRVKVVPGVSH